MQIIDKSALYKTIFNGKMNNFTENKDVASLLAFSETESYNKIHQLS